MFLSLMKLTSKRENYLADALQLDEAYQWVEKR